MPTRPRNNSFLLVEGKDDQHVFYSLLTQYQLPDNFDIKDKGGVEDLFAGLDLEIDSGLQKLGIVLDADTDLDARWQRLVAILKPRYPHMPPQPDPAGTILEASGQPRIGIWLMPDNKLPGMLEDFIALLVNDPANDLLWQLSQKCLNEAQALATNPIPTIKGRIHTYLAWQTDPGTPLGLAITKRYFDPSLPQAVSLIDWLNRLFN